MSPPHRPRLRPFLQATEIDPRRHHGKQVVLHDYLRLSPAQLPLTGAELEVVKLLDGSRTLAEIQAKAAGFLGHVVPLEAFASLTETLDRALFLDSPRFRAVADAPVRKPLCVSKPGLRSIYPGDPDEFREQMADLFCQPGAAGPPRHLGNHDRLRAVLAPHMDYERGGIAYSFAFKELVENTNASLFVLVGTSHHCGRRFTLTRKHFETPLGVVPTDQQYIDRLVAHHGGDLFQDEWLAHLPEHSIELEVVLLHYLYEKKRDIRIVPLVVGSFADCVATGDDPGRRGDIRRMVSAMAAAEREANEPICYIISGDLAHIGPKHSTAHPIREPELGASRAKDREILSQAKKADPAGYFGVIAGERDARKICGLPPTWLTLMVAQPSVGRVLRYDQFVDPTGYESVSFASVVFER